MIEVFQLLLLGFMIIGTAFIVLIGRDIQRMKNEMTRMRDEMLFDYRNMKARVNMYNAIKQSVNQDQSPPS